MPVFRFNIVVLFLFTLICCPRLTNAQVLINEIQSSNSSTIADEDGDYPDWIELYNSGTEPVDISGFGISDNASQPFKWVIPIGTFIQPNAYLLLFASSKNRGLIRGVQREVFQDIPGELVADLTEHPKFPHWPDERSVLPDYFEAPSNVGHHYGQRMFAWFKSPVSGVYMFSVAGDDNTQLYISSNHNPENASLAAEVVTHTGFREFNTFRDQTSRRRLFEAEQYYYLEVLMKEHEGDDHASVRMIDPDGVSEEPFSTLHLVIPVSQFHTSFNISADGEPITLTDSEGNLVDSFAPVPILTDHSYGRKTDGGEELLFFDVPTPGYANNASFSYQELLKEPTFSHAGGFFTQGFSLQLSTQHQGATILYTLDGSEPDTTALEGKTYVYRNSYREYPGNPEGEPLENTTQTLVYNSPISIHPEAIPASTITHITTDFSFQPDYFPSAPLPRGIVVRAKVVKAGEKESPTRSHTYFIFPNGRTSVSLPVFSIQANEQDLFDYETGIHVAGADFEQWREAHPDDEANGGVAFNWKRDTEIPVNIEFFDTHASSANLNQRAGLRLHGNWSRAHRLKSFRLYARTLYESNSFDYSFFHDPSFHSYSRLILRNAGNDFNYAFARDAIVQTFSENLNIDRMAYRPAVVFVNGAYWGMQNIRERMDAHYLNRHYGVLEHEVDLIENLYIVDLGDLDHYHRLVQDLEENDVADEDVYNSIKERMDVESFIDYQIANQFVGNTDWPANNQRMWRKKVDFTPHAPTGHDGRWRWMMYDTDYAFDIYGLTDVDINMFEFATAENSDSWVNAPNSTFLLRSLLTNNSFKHAFINRYNDLLNSSFAVEQAKKVISDIASAIEPEIQQHIQRWSRPSSYQNWLDEIARIHQFVEQRPEIVRDQMRHFFDFPGYVQLTLTNEHPLEGSIRVNRLDIDEPTWSGHYAEDIPITIRAVPKPNFAFSGWSGDYSSANEVITIRPIEHMTLIASFIPIEQRADSVLHALDFNHLANTEHEEISIGNAQLSYPGSGDGYMDRVNDGTSLNALSDVASGFALRVRNPSDTRLLVWSIPTTHFEHIHFSYAVKRTNNGATQQQIVYRAHPTNEWTPFAAPFSISEEYELVSASFDAVPESIHNPHFQIGIRFLGANADASSGNNRFDNMILRGKLIQSDTSIDKPNDETPRQLSLGKAYPNPFNPSTTIPYEIAQTGPVKLSIFDVTGRQVVVLVDQVQTSGTYQITFRADHLSSGVYFARLVQHGSQKTSKMILLK